MKSLYFKTALDWESWLAKNHEKEKELKIIFYKKHTGKACIAYEDAVKIALCYGWIDSLVNRVDDECFTRKFSIRKPNSVWSESNKKRVTELLKEGRMQPTGIRLVEIAKQNGRWDEIVVPPKVNLEISKEFKTELKQNPKALSFFESLTQSQRKQFIIWINSAKRKETIEKRVTEAINLLNDGKRLGLK